MPLEEVVQKSVLSISEELTQKMKESMEDSLKEIFQLLDKFRENQGMLAKTITLLPDQVLTYNEVAVAKIDRLLSEFMTTESNK